MEAEHHSSNGKDDETMIHPAQLPNCHGEHDPGHKDDDGHEGVEDEVGEHQLRLLLDHADQEEDVPGQAEDGEDVD